MRSSCDAPLLKKKGEKLWLTEFVQYADFITLMETEQATVPREQKMCATMAAALTLKKIKNGALSPKPDNDGTSPWCQAETYPVRLEPSDMNLERGDIYG